RERRPEVSWFTRRGAASMEQQRTYEPHAKHKAPKGYGSLCQKSVSLEHAQTMLREAIRDPDRPESRMLFAVCGEAVFVARPTRLEENIWHGYPEVGSNVSPRVLDELVAQGKLDLERRRRIGRQRDLPPTCGCA